MAGGAVTQQPLAPRAVSGLDAYRSVDGEATVVFPMRHRPRVIARQQAAAYEDAQQPPAHALLHFGEGWRIEPGGGMEDDPACGGGVEHAVDDHAMEVQVEIEGGTEAVNERDRAEARRRARTWTVRTQALLHRAQEHPQGRALEGGVAVQEVAQPLRHRQHPLPHWQAWEDVIRQMRRGLHHAPGIARRAHATSLAGERDQEVVAAVAAPRTREAVGEDAALQVAAELTLDISRNRTVVGVAVAALGEPGLEALLDAAIEHVWLGRRGRYRAGALSLARRSTSMPAP